MRSERPPESTAPIKQPAHSQSIDWYAEGEARTVDVGGVQITVRLVGRKGRRARIAITAPAGALFCSLDLNEPS